VYVVIKMAIVHEPIVVLYKSNGCRHCDALTRIWDSPPGRGEDSVVMALKKVYPKIRLFVVTAADNNGRFDENIAPKGLLKYMKWFPMILLVPGNLWDTAMSKLGPTNDVQLIDGVQIFNAVWKSGALEYTNLYDGRTPSEFGKWLTVALENPDFKRVQSGTVEVAPPSSTPALLTPAAPVAGPVAAPVPIPSLLSGIVRPNPTVPSASVLGSNVLSVAPASSTQTSGTALQALETPDGVCSMRIISRPHK
jgi:hypothetical protein